MQKLKNMFRHDWTFDCVPIEILNRRLRFCIECQSPVVSITHEVEFYQLQVTSFRLFHTALFLFCLCLFDLFRFVVWFWVSLFQCFGACVCVVLPCHVMIVGCSCIWFAHYFHCFWFVRVLLPWLIMANHSWLLFATIISLLIHSWLLGSYSQPLYTSLTSDHSNHQSFNAINQPFMKNYYTIGNG